MKVLAKRPVQWTQTLDTPGFFTVLEQGSWKLGFKLMKVKNWQRWILRNAKHYIAVTFVTSVESTQSWPSDLLYNSR